MNKAVVVFSGGQDSTTCLAYALRKYEEVHCITFDYGQRHAEEINTARKLAQKFNVSHKILDTNILNNLSASSLTRTNIPVQKHENSQDDRLPNTFVPGRNILFLILASIYAYQISAGTVITGVSETEFSGYPDCQGGFITALDRAISLGLDKNIKIETPLLNLTKAETWAMADYYGILDIVKNETLTCYNGIKSEGCGNCPSCFLRNRGLDQYNCNQLKIMKSFKEKAYFL